jgi:hypothetical protein
VAVEFVSQVSNRRANVASDRSESPSSTPPGWQHVTQTLLFSGQIKWVSNFFPKNSHGSLVPLPPEIVFELNRKNTFFHTENIVE